MALTNIPNSPPLANANAPGEMPAALYVATVALTSAEPPLAVGANLTDADATIQPATDKASQYTLPAATLTANRTLTLGTTSTSPGQTVRIIRRDRTGNTYSVGTLVTFPATPTVDRQAIFQFNGSYWLFIGWEFIQ